MSYFLDKYEETPQIKGRQPANERIPSWIEGLGASITSAALENDANFRAGRTRSQVSTERVQAATEALGPDRVLEALKERGMAPDTLEAFSADLLRYNDRARSMVLDLARQDAEANPQRWSEIDLSEEGIDAEANARMQADYEEAQSIIDMLPEGRVAAEFIGGMIGVTADIKNLPFLFLGGGSGSFMRVMGREAAINMAAEATFLPSQFAQAERLDIPDPDVTTQLAMAAGAGAVFGGAIEAGRRGLTYWKGRNASSEPLSVPEAAAVDTVEDALASETPNPIRDAMETARQETLILRNPINPERPPLVPDQIETSRLPPVEGGEPQPLPDPLLAQQAEAAISEAESEMLALDRRMSYRHPLSQSILGLGGIRWTRINPATGEKELTWVAQELMSRGVSQKQALSYIRREGSASLDNIDPSQIGRGIEEVIPMSDDGLYLDREALVDAMAREILGGEKTPLSGEIAARMRDISQMQEPPRTALDDYRAPPESADEFVINRDAFIFAAESEDVAMRQIAESVTNWMEREGHARYLTDAEKAEIIAQVQKDGGRPEYLVEQIATRELEFAKTPDEAPLDDIPWDDGSAGRTTEATGAGGGSAPEQPAPVARQEGGGAAVQGDGATPPREAQAVIPGTERVDTGQAQRDRAEIAARQQQSKIRRLDQTRVEDDAGGLFGGAQRSMFDDPASPDAAPVHQTVADDLRTQIEQDGDFDVMMDDGTMRPASEVLGEIDRAEAASARLDLCGAGNIE